MTIQEMKELYIEKALRKHKTAKEAAKVLGITTKTIENYKKKNKDGKKTLGA